MLELNYIYTKSSLTGSVDYMYTLICIIKFKFW